MAGNATGVGQFADGVTSVQEHLNHAQPMRVSQGLEAPRGLLQGIQGEQRVSGNFRFGGHDRLP
jgi:hypothetical protein